MWKVVLGIIVVLFVAWWVVNGVTAANDCKNEHGRMAAGHCVKP